MKNSRSSHSKHIKQHNLSAKLKNSHITSVQDAIHYLISGNYKGKEAVKNLFHSLNLIENFSHTHGLLGIDLVNLVKIIGGGKLSDRIKRRLILCLIPCSIVPIEAVSCVLCWICMTELKLNLKAELFKWILAVFECLEKIDGLQNLYEVILQFVEYDLLRPYVCQLLFKLTRPEDVQPYRIRHLIELQSRVGSQPDLLSLLCLYGIHKPEMIIVQSRYKPFFQYLGQLPTSIQYAHQRIQNAHEGVPLIGGTSYKSNGKVGYLKQAHDTKNAKTIKDLCIILKMTKPPNSITNLLEPSLRHFLFTSCNSSLMTASFSFWLRTVLLYELSEKSYMYKGTPLLKILADITEELKEGVPEVEQFLTYYLELWDGQTSLKDMLKFLEYWRLCSFSMLKEVVLQPLYKYFCTSSLDIQCEIIKCLTKLYENWVLWETPRHKALHGYQDKVNDQELALLLKKFPVFDREMDDLDPDNEIMELAQYIDKLSITSLTLNSDHPPLLLHNILSFYHTVLDVQTNGIFFLPSAPVIYGALFSTSAAPVTRVCQLIIRYKEAREAAKGNSQCIDIDVNTLNSYIFDMCNVLWRCRAFQPYKSSHLFHEHLSPSVSVYIKDAERKFILFNHPSLIALNKTFKERNTDVKLTIELHPYDKDIYHRYFIYLAKFGFWDVVKFIHVFIKHV